MSLVKYLIEFILHIDKHLAEIIASVGGWSYLILFAIVFAETGLVITPFLPGDSLLFAAGAFAALGSFRIGGLFLMLCAAAILGDTVNYAVGKFFGEQLLLRFQGRLIKAEHLDRTHRFFEKYGGKTIILARFVPIIRTFAPFVAGIGKMSYARFAAYNVIGGIAWVTLFVFAGYFFGNTPVVKKNFSLVIMAIIVLSVMPMVFEYWKYRREAGRRG